MTGSAALMTDGSPNSERMPPLASLRAFEASVRLRSLTRAAEELGVTPSAVTQHVRAIEAWVGAPLFRRTGREVIPSDIAEAALSSLREGFDRLAEGAQLLRSPDRKARVVSISAPPSFAAKWLLPRLDQFRALHPNVEVWVSADVRLVDFNNADVDLAVRFGGGVYEGLVAERVLDEAAIPVASPDLLAARGPILTATDILKAPLLHDISAEADPAALSWRSWFRARGVEGMRVLDGPRYNDSGLIIDEAIAGMGVALAKRTIAERDLQSGRLINLLGEATPMKSFYWLVWPRGRTLMPPVRAFIAWFRAETTGELTHGAGI